MNADQPMPPRIADFFRKLDNGEIKRGRGNKYQKENRPTEETMKEIRLINRARRWQLVLTQRPALKRCLQPEQTAATYDPKAATALQIALRIVSHQSGVPVKTLEKWLARYNNVKWLALYK